MPQCPVCGGTSFSLLASETTLHNECTARERFIRARLRGPVSGDELKDLTDFFHSGTATILECAACTLLVRSENSDPARENYAEDEYNPEAIEQVYPQYLAAFRAKEQPYRALLPAGARVVEVGSHYGAFLQTATEWGWRAEGVDVGGDTTRFARSKGFQVHRGDLSECGFADQSFDGVFVWNCFEQVPDPRPLLKEARRILRPDGIFVVRVPNGLFYAMCQRLLAAPETASESREFLFEAMAYNNLLGFPYQYGHRRATLERLIEPFDFRCEGLLNSELITLPLPHTTGWVERQEREINERIRLLSDFVLSDKKGILTGPWIELWFRAGIL